MKRVIYLSLAADSTLSHSIQSFSIPTGTSQHYPLHQHLDTIELLLVLNGTIHCKIDGKTFLATPGTVLFIQKGSWHEQLYVASGTQSGYRLSFCPVDTSKYGELPPIIPINAFESLSSLFMQLHQEKENPQPDSTQMAQYLLNTILLHVLRSVNKQKSTNYSNLEEMIQEIKYYMEENHSKPLSLEELASQFKWNKYKLARHFKQVTGISPLQYIICCRINTAKHLLCTSDSSVSKISSKIGYKSTTQFQAAFKKVVGITPRQYRIHSK